MINIKKELVRVERIVAVKMRLGAPVSAELKLFLSWLKYWDTMHFFNEQAYYRLKLAARRAGYYDDGQS